MLRATLWHLIQSINPTLHVPSNQNNLLLLDRTSHIGRRLGYNCRGVGGHCTPMGSFSPLAFVDSHRYFLFSGGVAVLASILLLHTPKTRRSDGLFYSFFASGLSTAARRGCFCFTKDHTPSCMDTDGPAPPK